MTEAVTYAVDADGICTLTMDLPGEKVNVIGEVLLTSLENQVKRAVADPAVKGVILCSGKPTFLAGGDLKAMGKKSEDARTPSEKLEGYMSLSLFLRRLETCGKPIACVLNGLALGGGFELALACHYRVVADDPKIQLGLPEAQVGLMPGAGGTQRLPRMIGVAAALPYLTQSKMMALDEALKLGLIDAVVPLAEAAATAKKWLLEKGDAVKPWDKKGFKVPGGGSSMERDFRNVFFGANVMTKAGTYGNYPAAEKILAALYEGVPLPMDKALKVEGRYFTQLMLDPVSGNLIRTMFINKGKADGLANRPKDVEKLRIKKIGIVGAGTMGGGIAFCAAKSGIDVVLIDRDMESAEKGRAYSQKKLARDLEKGRTTQDKIDAHLARITTTMDYASLADVDFAIESVFEDRQVKAEVIKQIEAAIPAHAFIGSNTSALPITELAEFAKRPERFIGLHFFSPVERIPLLEIIRGRKTDDQTWAQALDFAQAIKKTPITVNDGPGFFTTRFIGSFISASLAMINEGVTPALVENGAKMVGMPMGPLSVQDSVGLDVGHKAALAKARDTGTEFTPSLISKLVADHGRLGVKNGKGFFDYGPDGDKKLWPGLKDITPKLNAQPNIDEVKKRILYAQLAEGARAFSEGVLVDVIDGDLGATLGVGFPAYLGGPFAAMDTIGVANVVKECDRLAQLYGDAYKIPQILRDMAAKGQTFHGENAVKPPLKQAA
jgi:3-hydroxyacyl-CoA dehydrogenase/enoyl-CoA hydratase/3-hydroxybutyryl-CoA epimerase